MLKEIKGKQLKNIKLPMHNSIYEAVLSYSTYEAGLFFYKINELLPEVFEPLREAQNAELQELTLEEKKTVVIYIMHAYSRESPMIIAGATDERNKAAIADMVGLPDYLRGPVMLLKDQHVRDCIIRYLDAQKERDWHHLTTKKMQYSLLMDKSVTETKLADGKTDHKFILQCSESADRLLDSINVIEEKLANKYRQVDGAIELIKKANKHFERKGGDDDLSIEGAVRNKNQS